MSFNIWLKVEPIVGAVNYQANHTADDDSQEWQTKLTEVEVIDADVDEREAFKEAIIDAVDAACIDVRE